MLTWMAMRVHFWHRHVRDTVVILEEVNLPRPWCPLCDMLVLWKALNGTHRCTSQYNRGAEQKRRRLVAEEGREVTARDFSAYGLPLEMVTYFSGRASKRTYMMVQLCHRYVRDTVVILEEGNLPHPWFPLCDILLTWKDLNGMHRRTA